MGTSIRRQLIAVGFTSLAMIAPEVLAGDIRLTVTEVPNDQGYLMVSLVDRAEGFPRVPDPIAAVRLKARTGSMTVHFPELAPGTYAISIYHDENGNEKLDSNLLGMPTEAYGFSNDARGSLGPPKFEAAAFTVGEDLVHLSARVE